VRGFASFVPDCMQETGHGATRLPHRGGVSDRRDLNKIYGLVDKILVHGEGVKNEFAALFGDHLGKVNIQRHGAFEAQNLDYDMNMIDTTIVDRLRHRKKILIFFGNMFYQKGVDRLARAWLENFSSEPGIFLIIAGRKSAN